MAKIVGPAMPKKPDRRKTRKSDKPEPSTERRSHVAYPSVVKRRAYQLFMATDDKLRHKYEIGEIARILIKEFKDKLDMSTFVANRVYRWAITYQWHDCFDEMVANTVCNVASDLDKLDFFNELVDNSVPKFNRIDKLHKLVREKEFYIKQVDKFIPLTAATLVELMCLNHEHYKNLMIRRPLIDSNGEVIGMGFYYDVGKDGERKQLFDMWMQGNQRVGELTGTVTKHTQTTGTVSDASGAIKEVVIDTIEKGMANIQLSSNSVNSVLTDVAAQHKGGFGNDLVGPDNSEFPTEQGDPKFIPSSKDSADSES